MPFQPDFAFLDQASAYFHELQDRICAGLEEVESDFARSPGSNTALDSAPGPASFHEDLWDHRHSSGIITGGGGRTRVIQNGALLEKGGVNVSDVLGTFPSDFAASMPGSSPHFRASGISLVIHPDHPLVPTVHANFRYIARLSAPESGASVESMWFGGGADLTPYYLFREDAVHFHSTYNEACKKHGDIVSYEKFKKHCDEYFYLKHRGESRGIGGIFYDYQQENPDRMLEFTREAGNSFLTSYVPIVRRRMKESYTDAQKEFQLWRRGRYVEFNLIYDRGTLFGLKTGGRIESILMSLPMHVMWKYDYTPPENSPEAELIEVLRNPVDWIA
ncbi:MAG TPA: oxygen-dependent coproporphyrinogen oxidase [Leptospiraceae bacterium]|nr:oxygen-dependent coproporphyrinogen oxidase [Leptospiraceae bacterium]|tara:strand:+ start:52306 stop:53304 length:999 start_codon:yes stop_codon:yes gene_type:complete